MNNIQPKTLFTGKKSIYLPTCHSTNDWASQKIQSESLDEGTIVLTDNQTHGKGQRGNKWYAEPGKNLTFTLIYKPFFLPVLEQFKLNVAVSLAIADALSVFLKNEEVKIKWPNDIFVGQKKVGGILIESMIAGNVLANSMIGVGVNINQQHFSVPLATSLKNLTNQTFVKENVLETLCESIEKEYLHLKNGSFALQKERYLDRMFRREEWHIYLENGEEFEGRIKGIGQDGRLLMETRLGLIQFGNKEFEYII
ncbi:biotin--[acetyl-CoA-carboxylase] ligase [Jiulongibacter sediminis]|uniref:BPL/LPL catalytic domain-containing protein n=1 Tax=Jiulongibacter sediminis TaxID=1605367 RepID=A0A0P7C5L6_9BACT|nr:biotin--[acetyl-CoA-carboxylase] ligase [Jiulongibacter sediminis]KPM47462.1 hypothetical protein AFM12_13195 [Jiulongibacter sediminis]TBX23257.1 hypothetical protein TK44_13205 [Jiulongibacter sediminis]